MMSDNSPRCPRSTARTQVRLTRKRRWTRRKSPAAELFLELVDAADGGLQAPFLGHEPHVVAVRLREADLRVVQQHHPLAGHADDARRRAHPVLGRLVVHRIAVGGAEQRERPDGLVGQEDRMQGQRARLAAETGRDLRRADPVVVGTSLLGSVTGQPREVEGRVPAHGRVERGHARGDAEQQAGLLVGDDDLAAGVERGERRSRPRPRLRERGGQLGAAVHGAQAQDLARTADRGRQPAGRLHRKLAAPGRDVEDGDRVVGDGVANGNAGADPLVEAPAPVLGPVDDHRTGRLEGGAHPVGPRGPFRPARPRRHVALPRPAQRLLVAVDGQDPAGGVGDGDHAADALDLARDRGRGAAELSEHDLVLQRVLAVRLVLGGRGRRRAQARVDVVLLAAAVPGRGDLRAHAADTVVSRHEAFPRSAHCPDPLCVTPAIALCGLAHLWDLVVTYQRPPAASRSRVRSIRPNEREDEIPGGTSELPAPLLDGAAGP